MVSVVILNSNEPSVIQYTFEHLYSELKDIQGSELLIKDSWDISGIKNRFVCFVEPDCLVSPGYFAEQLEAFKKMSPRVAVLSSATAVKYWENKIYGYTFEGIYSKVLPNRKAKVEHSHPVQIAYIPGSIIRLTCLKKLSAIENSGNLVDLSSSMSLSIWQSGITTDAKHPEGQLGKQVYLNPKTTYVTTESYVNDMSDYEGSIATDLFNLFTKESV